MIVARLCLALPVLCLAASAQGGAPELPAPFSPTLAPEEAGVLRVTLDSELHAELRSHRRAVLRAFPLPGGRTVDLDLEQRSWRGTVGIPRVDGVERMDLYLGHDLTTCPAPSPVR